MTDSSEDVLRRCPLFRNTTEAERSRVLESAVCEAYPEGEAILREGRSSQALWVVLSGRCEVLKTRRTGEEQQLAVLEPAAVFGEMSFFNPAPHSATVKTLTETRVMRLSREAFERLQEECQPAAMKIACNTARVLAERLRRMDEWLTDFIEQPNGTRNREEWREFRSKLYSGWNF